ncbi:LacI family DNA-binding transcriptional regulator [Microlunatus phosphovorus]|uniref:LacI family DNA-binding transcriptional regulator n=1 Tax=Microlunatus phosphovorus TaxID=29405 RepID=UPI00155A4CBC|nr:LacI family DNA-binding transcriptional regulator [Microlunatus phosphovorus]
MASPTVAAVAAEAGVAKATAARTLGNYGAVSPEARARVLEAAARLRYRPNSLARSMTTGVTHTIGVVVADIGNPFFAGVLRGIADACDATDYTVIVMSADESIAKESSAIGVLMDKQVDGIVLASAAWRPDQTAHIQEAMSREIPIVLVDRIVPGLELDAVVIDNRQSARDAVRRFVAVGHRRIAFVWGPSAPERPLERERLLSVTDTWLWSSAERLRGYFDALDEAGIVFDPLLVSNCRLNEAATVDSVRAMLALPDPPTAVLTTETTATVGVLRATRDSRFAYPGDISVIGFDDSSWASVMEPPLTMIAQPMRELGRVAAELAFARIGGDRGDAAVETLPATFNSRASVTAPRPQVSLSDDDGR